MDKATRFFRLNLSLSILALGLLLLGYVFSPVRQTLDIPLFGLFWLYLLVTPILSVLEINASRKHIPAGKTGPVYLLLAIWLVVLVISLSVSV